MPSHPLAEVFGFPAGNFSEKAQRYRNLKLCSFNNRVPNCTKDSIQRPLGVCSVSSRTGDVTITYPVRFRQEWLIAEDAAKFFFSEGTRWTSLSEVRVRDRSGAVIGNIDIVIVAFDDKDRVVDFGSVEVQAVYISGNIRNPFEQYMENPLENHSMIWPSRLFPRADYLSSSRKRLLPQLLTKGGILNSWGKKQVVALDRQFFRTLPALDAVSREDAEIAWMIYDLAYDPEQNLYNLELEQIYYTEFQPALERIVIAEPGPVEGFIEHLQAKLDQKLDRGEILPDTLDLADYL